MGESALYPALQRILLNGWARASGARPRQPPRADCTITAAGRKQLAAERAEFNRMVGGIRRVLQGAT